MHGVKRQERLEVSRRSDSLLLVLKTEKWPWAKERECALEGEDGPQPTASKDTGTPRNPHTSNGLLPAAWMSLEVDSSLEPPERNPTLQTP